MWISEQNGLLASGALDIDAAGHAHLRGGLIQGAEGASRFKAHSISYEDIRDHNKSESFSFNASYSGIAKPQGQSQGGIPGMIGFSYQKNDKRGLTHPTVSGAEIETIEAQDLSGLNRAIEKAREITLDKQTKVKLTIPIINPEGLQNDWNQIERASEEISRFFVEYLDSGLFQIDGQSVDEIINSIQFLELADKIKQLPNPLRAKFAQKILNKILLYGVGKQQDFGNCGLVCNQVFLYLMLSGQVITEKQLSKVGLSKEIVMDEKKFLDWSIKNGYANDGYFQNGIMIPPGGTNPLTRQSFFSKLGIKTTYNEKPTVSDIISPIRANKGVQISFNADRGRHAVTAQQIYRDKDSGKTYVVINNSGWSPNGLAPSATQAVAIDDLMKMQPRIIVTEPKLWGIHSVKADRPIKK